MGDTIDERDIYKSDDFLKLVDDLEMNLDFQRELTEAREKQKG